ncbi:MAG: branched-chain amino acid ABC transporter permease [Desulfobacterales bacterium]|jgi:branched-chain amino acid transport system permease protein
MQQTLFHDLFEWLKTAAGITILMSIAVAIVATVDRGLFILINTVVTGGMLAMVAIGLAMVLGVMNVVQFAHGEYFMIGSLTAYYIFTPIAEGLSRHPNPVWSFCAPFVAIFSALIAGALAGALTERLVFRQLRKRSRENWVMNTFLLTVGLNVVLINGHQLLFGTDFKGITRYWSGPPVSIADVYFSRDRAMVFLLAVVICVLFWLFMGYTRTGRAIRSVSQDETGALMMGINLDAIMTLTMAIGCGLAAVAGGSLLFMYPSYPTVGLEPLYLSWIIVIFVGLGNIMGAFVGGFIVALLKVLTVEYIGAGWDFVVPVGIIIIVLIFKPSGVFGTGVRGVFEQ